MINKISNSNFYCSINEAFLTFFLSKVNQKTNNCRVIQRHKPLRTPDRTLLHHLRPNRRACRQRPCTSGSTPNTLIATVVSHNIVCNYTISTPIFASLSFIPFKTPSKHTQKNSSGTLPVPKRRRLLW